MVPRAAIVAVILAVAAVRGAPDEATIRLTADPIHPDTEARITFKASTTMPGVERMELSIASPSLPGAPRPR